MKYVTDLRGYEGSLDRISPYHCYQHFYWTLRGKWRNQLYAWTRRDACDAQASVEPAEVVADVPTTLTLSVQIGRTRLTPGARLAVYFPLGFGGYRNAGRLSCFQGPDGQTGYGARITAHTSRHDAALAVQVHSTGSGFLCVELILESGELAQGDGVFLVIGDPSCRPPVISERAKTFPLRVAIDYAGDDTFRPVIPNPIVRVVGAKAHYLRCFAPATPKIDEPFSVRVVAADLPNHNPDYHHRGRLFVSAASGAIANEAAAEMSAEHHGAMEIAGVAVTRAGVTRIQVHDRANGLLGLSNPICPEMAPRGLQLYYGDIHSHTELSDGAGLPEDNFHWARDVEGLDFAALADHFEDGQSYNYTLEDKWRITKEVTERFNAPGKFVTLLGYEIGTVEAHRNVYFADGEGRMIVQGRDGETVTMDNVFGKLDGMDYVLIPHAPKFHGINWRRPHNPATQRLVEICSIWGISEEGATLSVRHALDLGYKFGFTGGTDNHLAEPGNPDLGGITGVFARSLSRRDIFEALQARRTFATNGQRMILNFSVNDAFMGEELDTREDEPRHVCGRVVAGEGIACLEIIRNGEVVYEQQTGGADDAELEWNDAKPLAEITPKRELTVEQFAYYYLRVRTVYGNLGWSSPVWIRRQPAC